MTNAVFALTRDLISRASVTPATLQRRVHAILDSYDLKYELTWSLSGEPFLTPVGELSRAMVAAIADELGIAAELSTTGGTSDGRFIARLCPQVLEFSPINATIHQIDEHIAVDTLTPLKNVYRRTLEHLLGTHAP